MSEDPEITRIPEPDGESAAGNIPPAVDKIPPAGESSPESVPPGYARLSRPDSTDEDAGQGRRTGSLLRRITGSIRRRTGPLGEQEPKMPDLEGRLDRLESEPQAAAPEKRKGITGQLGSIITGILRGTPAEGEPSLSEQRPHSEVDEYVSELRQSLATEEASRPRPAGMTGRLIHTLTGSLRRMTGPLGQPGQLFNRGRTGQLDTQEPPPLAEPLDAEIEEDILAGRLSTTSIAEPAVWVEPEDFVIEMEEPDKPLIHPLDEPFAMPEPEEPPEQALEPEVYQPLEPEPAASDALPDSSILAPAHPDEQEARRVESQQAWMEELRHETAELEGSGDQGAGRDRRRFTEQLKFLVTGILRRPEGRKTGPVTADEQAAGQEESQAEVSDDLVTGRLGRSLGLAGEEQPGMDHLPGFQAEGPARPAEGSEPPAGEITVPPFLSFTDSAPPFEEAAPEVEEGTVPPFTSFADSAPSLLPAEETGQPFAPFGSDQEESPDSLPPIQPPPPSASAAPEEEAAPFVLSPEDERLIWGDPAQELPEEGRTIRAEDFWDQIQLSRDPDAKALEVSDEDAYAAAFLTGEDTLPDFMTPRKEVSLRKITELQPDKNRQEPFEDIRSIVLEGVPAEERPHPQPVREEEPAGEADAEAAAQPDAEAPALPVRAAPAEVDDILGAPPVVSRKARLASLPLMQKILLAEIIVVGIALLVAVPYFLILMMRNPTVEIQPTDYLVPRSLPEGVPHPTGMTLPGGWYFSLGKSTFVGREWKPAGGEWLEGSELRRVVALPWNPQTEAVVQSFGPGDTIQVYLSDSSTITYKVTSIERVPVDEVEVFKDLRPSLAVILFQEDSDQRWVVISHR